MREHEAHVEIHDMSSPTLRAAWCQHFHIDAEAFPRHFVRRCHRRRSRWLAPLWCTLNPGCFRLDYKAAELLGQARSLEEVVTDLNQIAYHDRVHGGWARRWFGVGLSRRKVVDYTAACFGG